MKPVVKYLLNGEYQYATVKDIGDIEKLKTKVKTDIVSAINELTSGVENSESVKDINNKISEIISGLDGVKKDVESIGSSELNDKQKEQIEEILKDIPKVDYERINEDINKKMEETKKEIAATTESIKEDIATAKNEILDTKSSLDDTKKDLSNVKLNYNDVKEKYDEVTGELSKTIKKTEFNLLESQVSENERILNETVDGVKDTVKRKEWDTAQDRVANLETTVERNADGIKRTMTKEEIRKEISLIDTYRPNLIMGTLDWSGWNDKTSIGVENLSETYQHCSVVSISSNGKMTSYVDDLESGKTYQASIWAKASKGARSSVTVSLIGSNGVKRTETLNVDDSKDVGESWRRYTGSIVAPDNGRLTIVFQPEGLSSDSISRLLLAGAKLEYGANSTGWNVHPSDNYDSIVKLSMTVKETADGIKSVNESVVKTNKSVVKNSNEISSLSNSHSQTIKKVEDVEGETKRLQNSLEKTAESLKSKVTKEDVTEIFDGMESSNANLITNGNFFDEKTGWTTGKEWSVVDKSGRNYLYVTRSGLTNDMDISAFSNFISAQHNEKLSFGLDMFIDDISKYDTRRPVRIEFYDKTDSRVDFKEYQLSELISNPGNGHNSRLGGVILVDRKDVYKARIRVSLQRNGGVGFTNISLRIGALTDKSWMPSPGDSGVVTAKLETMISQKADGLEVNSIKKEVDKANQSISESEAAWKIASSEIRSDIKENYASKIDLGSVEEKATSAQQTVDGFKQEVEKKYAHKDDLETVELKVSSAQQTIDGFKQEVARTYANKSELELANKKISKAEQDISGFTQEVKSLGETVIEKTDGKISSIISEYYLSNSDKTLSGGRWSVDVPDRSKGTWIWTRSKMTTGGGEIRYSPSETGMNISGKDGLDGKSSYFHTAWANGINGEDFTLEYPKENLIDMSNLSKMYPAGSNNLVFYGSKYYHGYYMKVEENDVYSFGISKGLGAKRIRVIALKSMPSVGASYNKDQWIELAYAYSGDHLNNVKVPIGYGYIHVVYAVSDEIDLNMDSKLSIYKSDKVSKLYLPSKKNDPERYPMRYSGVLVDGNEKPSSNFKDYTWHKIHAEDGDTSYFYTAYANSPDGSVDFTTRFPSDARSYSNYAFNSSDIWESVTLDKKEIVEVKIVLKDDSGALIKTKSVSYELGSNQNIYADDIEHYEIVGSTNKEIVVAKNMTVEFVYKKIKYFTPVEIKYMDGSSLIKSQVDSFEIGTTHVFKAINIDGYTLLESDAKELKVEKGLVVIFRYEKIIPKTVVIINHVDENGKILSKKEETHAIGETVDFKAQSIDGYTLDDSSIKKLEISKDLVVQFKYKTKIVIVNTKVEIIAKSQEDSSILSTSTETHEVGKSALFNAPQIDKYTLVGESTQLLTVEDGLKVTFMYKKKTEWTSVIIRHIDASTKAIIKSSEISQIVGSNQVYTSESIDHFNVSGSYTQGHVVKSGLIVTFEYSRIVLDVSINIVDLDENRVLRVESVRAESGLPKTFYAPDVDGYNVDGVKSKTENVKSGLAIDFYYRKADDGNLLIDTGSPVMIKSKALSYDYHSLFDFKKNLSEIAEVGDNLIFSFKVDKITERSNYFMIQTEQSVPLSGWLNYGDLKQGQVYSTNIEYKKDFLNSSTSKKIGLLLSGVPVGEAVTFSNPKLVNTSKRVNAPMFMRMATPRMMSFSLQKTPVFKEPDTGERFVISTTVISDKNNRILGKTTTSSVEVRGDNVVGFGTTIMKKDGSVITSEPTVGNDKFLEVITVIPSDAIKVEHFLINQDKSVENNMSYQKLQMEIGSTRNEWIPYGTERILETIMGYIGTYSDFDKNQSDDPKRYSWSKFSGKDGATGRGILSVVPEFYLSNSDSSLIGGSWSKKPDTWVKGKWQWTRNKITYKNPSSVEYTTPVIDSSWKAIESESNEIRRWTETKIQQTSDSWGVDIKELKKSNHALRDGKILYPDPLFQEGLNGLATYNESDRGSLTIDKIDDVINPTDSNTVVRVKSSGSTSPGYGGVSFLNKTRSGAKFVYKITAKIPNGHKINWKESSYGVGHQTTWVTDQEGTGNWEDYILMLHCGASGDFEAAGKFFVSGEDLYSEDNPLVWDICFATVIDITSYDTTLRDLKKEVEFKLTPDEIYGMVSTSIDYQDFINELATSEEFDNARSEIDKMQDIISGSDGVVERFGKFEQTANEFGVKLGDLVKQVDGNNVTIEDMTHFMAFKRGQKPTDAYMSIGSSADSMEVQIGRGKISFFDGGVEVAYFSKQQLYIKKSIMTDSFQVGSHTFENEGNGSTVLTYSK